MRRNKPNRTAAVTGRGQPVRRSSVLIRPTPTVTAAYNLRVMRDSSFSMSVRTSAMSPFVATSSPLATLVRSVTVESMRFKVVVPCLCDDGDVDLQQCLSKRFRLVHVSNPHFANPGPRIIVRRPKPRVLE